MNVWIEGLQVALLGMLIVFAGLILLIVVIRMIRGLSGGAPRAKAPQAEPVPVPAAPVAVQAADPMADGALVAAISAAVACMLAQGQPTGASGFVVRRIWRV